MSVPSRRLVPLAVLTLFTGFAVAIVTAPEPASASGTLRSHAAARGKFIGYAAATGPLANETAYRNIAGSEFNQVTAENAMKWDATEPQDNQYNFTGADQVVAFAQANNQRVHGHTLVWHSQTPGWVQGLSGTAMRTAMQDHISRVVGRWANDPIVESWDVVNEVFNEDGSLRQSFWLNAMGQSYIADAFRFARAADPDARLCINDYNVEGINAKSTAMYNLVQQLRAQNVPVDCVGFQAHLAVQFGFPGQYTQNIARFAALGVQVRITELDVRIPLPADQAEITRQNQYYTQIVDGCMQSTACAGVTIWGFTDRYSWVPDTFQGEGQALIYDTNYSPKPAYTAVHDALDDGDPGGDTQPPTTPTGLTASGVTSNSVNLSWTASTDNVGVTGYDIIRNGTVTNTVAGTSTTVTGLSPSTAYQFAVRARDAAGNTSANSATVNVTTQPGSGGGGCSATGTVQTQWGNGYVVQPVTVTNTGTSAITGWTVTLTLPSGHSLTGQWNATISPTSGAVTARNMSYNGNLGPGQSTTFGFQVSRPNGNTAVPSGYTCTAS
ncbi:endo-1,4-beta-xylanase [Allorhizocola rhizosphaerae]|uniref:endo-1,4-beta-xylanase n=1 Tax=Allorhizocola rhizosphaerae TaxID=1872709 RepID=UPI000E3E6449|nr:endo-1,4-beta-xylanase [Allorhizocola rhizosphaerae]